MYTSWVPSFKRIITGVYSMCVYIYLYITIFLSNSILPLNIIYKKHMTYIDKMFFFNTIRKFIWGCIGQITQIWVFLEKAFYLWHVFKSSEPGLTVHISTTCYTYIYSIFFVWAFFTWLFNMKMRSIYLRIGNGPLRSQNRIKTCNKALELCNSPEILPFESWGNDMQISLPVTLFTWELTCIKVSYFVIWKK